MTQKPAEGTGSGADAGSGAEDLRETLAARWLELDPDRGYQDRLAELGGPVAPRGMFGRAMAAIVAPRERQERRDLFVSRADMRRETTAAFLVSAWETAGRPQFVLALDADDILIVEPIRAAGARLAPGGLRWLADYWDAAGRPQPGPGVSTPASPAADRPESTPVE